MQEFLNFVLECWKMLIYVLQYTNIGGVSMEFLLVSSFILTIIVRVLVVRFGKDG